MLFEYSLTVPADRSEIDPAEVQMLAEPGTVTRLSCYFPAGCQRRVGAQILYGRQRIWPLSTDRWAYGEDEIVTSGEMFKVPGPPALFVGRAISPGTTYDHKIAFRIEIIPLTAIDLEKVADIIKSTLEEQIGAVPAGAG